MLSFAVIGAVSAQAITFNFSNVFSGDTPSGPPAWASLTIVNDGTVSGLNKVKFTLTNLTDPASGQFITELLLNLTSIPSDFAFVTGSDTPSGRFTGDSHGSNFVNDAGEKFDYDATFNIPNNGKRVIGGTSVSWDVKGTGLDANHFLTFATPQGDNPRDIYAMVHMQGLPNGGSAKLNGTVAVPEPTSMAALGIAAVGLLRKRRK
ncbi:MAG: PEP-CTERM sorting domain-containing protein [Armatimonadetes bacterium]|nr:PEP-CTERM sorting domain-containing protein [Armatimonadota bacterium]